MNLISIQNRLAKIGRSPASVVMFLTFIGMMLGLVDDILIAAKLGTTITADALIVALSLPRLVDTIARDGTKFSLVAFFMECRNSMSKDKYHSFVSNILNRAFILGVGITIIFEILAPYLVTGLAPGFSLEGTLEATLLFRICVPMIIFSPAITVLSVFLNSQKRFNSVALRNAIAPGVVLVAIVCSWNRTDCARWVTAAYVIGFAGFLITVFTDAIRAGYKHRWLTWNSQEKFPSLWNSAGIPTLGFMVGQGGRLVTRQVLVSLASVGGVSTFYFAVRILSAAQSLIGVSLATISLPGMTENDLAGHKTRLASALRKNLTRVLWVSLPALMIIAIFHEKIIDTLYGHGSFGTASIQQTSQVLLWLGLGLTFNCFIPVLNAGLYAQRSYKLVFNNMVFMTAFSIITAYIFLKWQGLIGIAMAATLSALIEALIIVYILYKKGISLLPED